MWSYEGLPVRIATESVVNERLISGLAFNGNHNLQTILFVQRRENNKT